MFAGLVEYIKFQNNSKQVIFLSICNEAQCVPLQFLSWKFFTNAPSFILGKLFLEKTPLNLGLYLKQLVISILFKVSSGTKNFYLYILFLLFQFLFHLYLLLLQKLLVALMKWKEVLTKLQEIYLLVFIFHFFLFK